MELTIVSKRDNLEKATAVLRDRAAREGLTITEVVHELLPPSTPFVHKYTTEAV